MLAAVSGGQAGNTPGAGSFGFSVDPELLTVGQNGLAQGVLTTASGQGQGSATNVKMTVTLPAGLNGGQPGTSSGCTTPPGVPSTSPEVWTCTIGTVNAGNKVKRFLVFTAETASETPYTVIGCVALDGGSGGAGGGGGMQTCADNTITDTTKVVVTTSPHSAGNCTGNPATAPFSKTNPNIVTTSVSGSASASLGLPCTWAFAGVKDKAPGAADAELVVPQIAFMGFPQTDADAPVIWTSLLASRPSGPFEDVDPLVDMNYTANSTNFQGVEPPDCVDLVAPFGPGPQNKELPAGADVCVVEFVKVGAGARLTMLIEGTGGDPGNGWG